MEIDWPRSFGAWLDTLEARADRGDGRARETLDLVLAELKALQDLTEVPAEETATLKVVRQSRTNIVWRVSHPYRENTAVRLICWFPPGSNTVVVAHFAGDKEAMGDVFYNSVGSRADASVDTWKHESEWTDP